MYQFYSKGKARIPLRHKLPSGHFLRKSAFVIILFLAFSLVASAQQITLKETNAPLKKVFLDITKQSNFEFLASTAVLNAANPVTIDVSNQPLASVLQTIFKSQPLKYEIKEKIVVVTKKESPSIPPRKEEGNTAIIHGRVTDSIGNTLPGATIKNETTGIATISANDGEFSISANIGDRISASFVGYLLNTIEIQNDSNDLQFVLKLANARLTEVNIVSTGYENIPKERATGSFSRVNNELLNRAVSTDILNRLDGITSGLNFNRNRPTDLPNNSLITVHGRSTLFANAAPLIILDNFPYDGDINNINPNDIETITVLKDAAAASIWGARSGNGVIVITTKKGQLNQNTHVEFVANTTVSNKPNLYYSPQLTPAQYIEAEQFLFNKGAFNTIINNGYSALSPAVEVFLAKRNGTITIADSLAQINKLKAIDYRDQLSKYYYRNGISQQYQANISGGGSFHKYFLSGGYDKNIYSNVGADYARVTLNASNSFYLLKNKLEFYSNIVYTGTKNRSVSSLNPLTPYIQIADDNGNSLAVANTLRLTYAQNAGGGKLLNWLYRPLDELNNNYSSPETNQIDYRINFSLNYKILEGLKTSVLYSYENANSRTETLNELQSYYTRNLINSFSQINTTTGVVTYPLPLGAIDDQSETSLTQQNGRFQLSYDHTWKKHRFSGITGTEFRSVNGGNIYNRFYGYNPETLTNQNAAINYANNYPNFYGSTSSSIGIGSGQSSTTNHYLSYFANGSYSYDGRYIVSLSARKDESNIFGVSTNQKGVPLWSAGIAWVINDEEFYKNDWLPLLKLRATYGFTGNVSSNLSAILTTQFIGSLNTFNVPYSTIGNPPNPSLRWEKIGNLNIGLDFGIKNNRINGSIDFWQKKGLDLIGNSPVAPQTGITLYTGNSANTLTKGADILLNALITTGQLKWTTSFLYNYSSSKVTEYQVSNGTNLNVVSANYNNPLAGYPYYSIFSFKYAGLNNQGNPQGYLNGNVSSDYSSIVNSSNRDELVYNGPATPTSFGSLRNTFSYKRFEVSFILSYRLGYYFRRVSLNNAAIYSSAGGGYQSNTDYDLRWQKAGDELNTNVPSLVYPVNPSRDALYTYSSSLVEKADNIRLQDLRLAYSITNNPNGPVRNLTVFGYLNNLGIIWRANKYHLDPDYPAGIPTVQTFAIGLKASL